MAKIVNERVGMPRTFVRVVYPRGKGPAQPRYVDTFEKLIEAMREEEDEPIDVAGLLADFD